MAVPPGCPVASADDDPRAQVVQHQQRTDAVCVRNALVYQALQFTVHTAPIFVRGCRLVQYRPDTLASVVAQQHRQQLVAVEAIALCTPRAPVDLDAGRVDHDVVDALLEQPSVQPPAVSPGFVAAMYLGLVGQPEAGFGLAQTVSHSRRIAGSDVAAGVALGVARSDLPLLVAELEDAVQLSLRGRILASK